MADQPSWQTHLINWVQYARRGSRIYDAGVISAVCVVATLLPKPALDWAGLLKFRGDIAGIGLIGVIVMFCTAVDRIRYYRRLRREIERLHDDQLRALLDLVHIKPISGELVVYGMLNVTQQGLLTLGILINIANPAQGPKYKVLGEVADYVAETFDVWKAQIKWEGPKP